MLLPVLVFPPANTTLPSTRVAQALSEKHHLCDVCDSDTDIPYYGTEFLTNSIDRCICYGSPDLCVQVEFPGQHWIDNAAGRTKSHVSQLSRIIKVIITSWFLQQKWLSSRLPKPHNDLRVSQATLVQTSNDRSQRCCSQNVGHQLNKRIKLDKLQWCQEKIVQLFTLFSPRNPDLILRNLKGISDTERYSYVEGLQLKTDCCDRDFTSDLLEWLPSWTWAIETCQHIVLDMRGRQCSFCTRQICNSIQIQLGYWHLLKRWTFRAGQSSDWTGCRDRWCWHLCRSQQCCPFLRTWIWTLTVVNWQLIVLPDSTPSLNQTSLGSASVCSGLVRIPILVTRTHLPSSFTQNPSSSGDANKWTLNFIRQASMLKSVMLRLYSVWMQICVLLGIF